MELITRQDLANSAAERYRAEGQVIALAAPTRAAVQHMLDCLPANPDPDRVNQILGRPYWTRIICSVCEHEVEEAIDFYQEANYSTCYVCRECLVAALDLFTDNASNHG